MFKTKNSNFRLRKNIASKLKIHQELTKNQQIIRNTNKQFFSSGVEYNFTWSVTETRICRIVREDCDRIFSKQTALTKIKTVVFSLFR